MKVLGWLGLVALPMCSVACSEPPESHLMPSDLYVTNVVSADITGDGTSDLIVDAIELGVGHQTYLLDGATDLDLAAGNVLRSWTSRTEWLRGAGSLIVSTARGSLLLVAGPAPTDPDDDSVPGNQIVALRLPDLELVWRRALPEFLSSLWVDVVSHGNRDWLYAGAGALLARVPVDELPADTATPGPSIATVELPPPTTDWDGVVTAIDVGEAGLGIVSSRGIRTNVDAALLAPDAWSTVRQGAYWEAQTRVDLDGDGHDEIVGFDLEASQLCAIDLERSISNCLPVPSPSVQAGAKLVVASPSGASPGRDVLLVRTISASGGVATNRADLFRSVAFQGASLQQVEHGVAMFEASGPVHVVELQRDWMSASAFMLLTKSGEARCISRTTAAITSCAD